MKSIILVVSLILIFILPSSSQSFNLGLKAGIHNSLFAISSEGQNSNSFTITKLGLHAGILADFKFDTSFSIQPQLLFATKGGKAISGGEFSFNTLDLSFNFCWNHQNFFLGAGPNLSYLLTGKSKTAGSTKVIDLFKDSATLVSIKTSRLEIGGNFLMGYKFPGGFLLSTSFTPSFKSVLKNVSANQSNTLEAHNNLFGFSIGYLIPRKR